MAKKNSGLTSVRVLISNILRHSEFTSGLSWYVMVHNSMHKKRRAYLVPKQDKISISVGMFIKKLYNHLLYTTSSAFGIYVIPTQLPLPLRDDEKSQYPLQRVFELPYSNHSYL